MSYLASDERSKGLNKLLISKKIISKGFSLTGGLFLLAGILSYDYAFSLPRPDYLQSQSVVDTSELAIMHWTSYAHDFFLACFIAAILAASLLLSRRQKKIATMGLVISASVFLNVAYFWTSHWMMDYSISIYDRFMTFVIELGNVYSFFGLPVSSYPIDLTVILLFGIVALFVFSTYSKLRSLQILGLLILPLPIEIFFFDYSEFHVFFISVASVNPILAEIFTNANILYGDLALLLGTSLYSFFWRRTRP